MWGWHAKLNNHKNLPQNLASFSESGIKRLFDGPVDSNWPTLHRRRGEKLLFCYSWPIQRQARCFMVPAKHHRPHHPTANDTESFERQPFYFLPSGYGFLQSIRLKGDCKIFFDSCPTVSKEARKSCFRPWLGYLRKRSIKWNYINFQSLAWKQGNFGGRRFNSTDKQDFVSRAWGWDPTLCKRFHRKRRETVGVWK